MFFFMKSHFQSLGKMGIASSIVKMYFSWIYYRLKYRSNFLPLGFALAPPDNFIDNINIQTYTYCFKLLFKDSADLKPDISTRTSDNLITKDPLIVAQGSGWRLRSTYWGSRGWWLVALRMHRASRVNGSMIASNSSNTIIESMLFFFLYVILLPYQYVLSYFLYKRWFS